MMHSRVFRKSPLRLSIDQLVKDPADKVMKMMDKVNGNYTYICDLITSANGYRAMKGQPALDDEFVTRLYHLRFKISRLYHTNYSVFSGEEKEPDPRLLVEAFELDIEATKEAVYIWDTYLRDYSAILFGTAYA